MGLKMKVLWLSPNLNHYKARFLNYLSESPEIDLSVLSGIGRKGQGDKYITLTTNYHLKTINVTKAKFGFSGIVRQNLKECFEDFEWIMIPREKKNFFLILYAFWLRAKSSWKGKKVKLISYNHPMLISGPGRITWIDEFLTWFYYRFYDRIIFYTEKSHEKMVRAGVINKKKAFWANNTIDTSGVSKHYKFSYPNPNQPTILFIGRLTPEKNLEALFDYYFELKEQLQKEGKNLTLIIIGDGPQQNLVKNAIIKDSSIEWTGSLVNESEISPYMQRASLVFVPGHSGLSINHAFCYGRPYFTLDYIGHPPEIDYLENGYNGFIMSKSKVENIKMIRTFLLSSEEKIYDNAYKTGQKLSTENWCRKIKEALIDG